MWPKEPLLCVWRWLRCHAPGVPELVKRSLLTLQVAHSEELEALQKLLHFPEEVALRLADTEYHLFYQVPPIDYLRQVTLDLGGGIGDVPTPVSGPGPSEHSPQPATESATSASASAARPSVRSLIKRFNEVQNLVFPVDTSGSGLSRATSEAKGMQGKRKL